jgi:hypothetical protein
MKRALLLLTVNAILAIAAYAQWLPICQLQWICTPYGGCRWVEVCH